MSGLDRRPSEADKPYSYGTLIDAGCSPSRRLAIGVPMTGQLRSEWVMARYGQTFPSNWSSRDYAYFLDQISPLNFDVANARNYIATQAVEEDFEWLFFIDHDVVLPPATLLKMDEHIRRGDRPIVSGLYFTKGVPASPLIYRGMGNSHYDKWKIGDKVDAGGCGLGVCIINVSILKAMWKDVEEYTRHNRIMRRFFRSPATQSLNESGFMDSLAGTEDIDFFSRVHNGRYYEKAGYPEVQAMEWPLLIDTSIFCKHITPDGKQYPLAGEEQEYMEKGDA